MFDCLCAGAVPLDAIKMLIEMKATPLFGDAASGASWYAGHTGRSGLAAQCSVD